MKATINLESKNDVSKELIEEAKELNVTGHTVTVSSKRNFPIRVDDLGEKKIQAMEINPENLRISYYRKDGWEVVTRLYDGEFLVVTRDYFTSPHNREYLTRSGKWKDNPMKYYPGTPLPSDAFKIPLLDPEIKVKSKI